MTAAYATVDELGARLPAGTLPDEADRLLVRASELIDDKVRAPFTVDTVTSLPTDDTVAGVLRDAVCAQVEFWVEVGEEHDVAGLGNRQASVGQLSMAALPPELAPRAYRLLHTAGLLGVQQPAVLGCGVWP